MSEDTKDTSTDEEPKSLPSKEETSKTSEVEPDHQGEETAIAASEEPKLIFGKYKSEEDALKAHQEAERKMHEATQEAARLREQLDKNTPSDEELESMTPEEKGAWKRIYQAIDKKLEAYIAPLAEKTKEVAVLQEVNSFVSAHPEFNQIKDVLVQIRMNPERLKDMKLEDLTGTLLRPVMERSSKTAKERTKSVTYVEKKGSGAPSIDEPVMTQGQIELARKFGNDPKVIAKVKLPSYMRSYPLLAK